MFYNKCIYNKPIPKIEKNIIIPELKEWQYYINKYWIIRHLVKKQREWFWIAKVNKKNSRKKNKVIFYHYPLIYDLYIRNWREPYILNTN